MRWSRYRARTPHEAPRKDTHLLDNMAIEYVALTLDALSEVFEDHPTTVFTGADVARILRARAGDIRENKT